MAQSDDQNGKSQSTQDERLIGALKEAWDEGYKAALRSVREMADEANDPMLRAFIVKLADCLEATRP